MNSCIYEGRVRHTRRSPSRHQFRYRLFMMYLDLDELPGLFDGRWFWSASRPAPARFRRRDHLGPPDQPLSEAVRDRIESETGHRPAGPIRLLTNLSYFGYCFNPVSFYYCFAQDNESVEYVVAEVNNTPWGEQDTYVLSCKETSGDAARWRFQPRKKMHVSPFMPMDVDYDWVLTAPAAKLSVRMANSTNGERIFDAAMQMQRTRIDGRTLSLVLLRFPLMTLKVIAAIYWEALRLWLKRCPVYVHPRSKNRQVA